MDNNSIPSSLTIADEKRAALRSSYAERGAAVDGGVVSGTDSPLPFSLSLEGLEGTGKSHFIAMTMPTPLVLVNFGDRTSIPFLYQMSEERRAGIYMYDIQAPSAEGWDLRSAVDGLRQLTEIIAAEGPLMQGGTFALDGGSSWWGTMQQVFVEPKEKAREAEGKKQVGGIIYEEANGRARGVISYARSLGCYFAMTHQLKQNWDNQGPIPNSYSARRNSQVQYLVEVVIRFAKVCVVCNAPTCQNADHSGRKFKARLEKLAGNPALEGLWVDDLDFEALYTFQTGKPYPGVIVK